MRMSFRVWRIGVGAFVVAACLLGVWESWKILRSDELNSKGTAESIRAAIRLEPSSWWYYIQLAQLDDGDAKELLQSSLLLNPYNSDAAIDLGLRFEADGDFVQAEKYLLQAFAVDRTYAPRWTLANFYFRRDNLSSFWIWARRAAEMPQDDIGALFELCWRVSDDPKTIEANLVNDNPLVLRQFVDFLIRKDQAEAAAHPAWRLVRVGSQELDRQRVFDVINRVIDRSDAMDADKLWNDLISQRWIVADASIPNNPQFARDPLPVNFDWNLPGIDGLHSWPGPSGLVTEFTGDEPETWIIAQQAISLSPGNYNLQSSYHTRDIAAGTGIRWEIGEIHSDTVLANSPFLSSDTPVRLSWPFSVDANHHLLWLRLVYHREVGTPRVAGTLVVPSIRIEASPSK
jgi:hypothetical protein